MAVRILVVAGMVLMPNLAVALDVPEGEVARKAWCSQYVTVLEPRKPKFMTGSSLNQDFWRNATPDLTRKKQAHEYEASLEKFKQQAADNHERVGLCKEWGYQVN